MFSLWEFVSRPVPSPSLQPAKLQAGQARGETPILSWAYPVEPNLLLRWPVSAEAHGASEGTAETKGPRGAHAQAWLATTGWWCCGLVVLGLNWAGWQVPRHWMLCPDTVATRGSLCEAPLVGFPRGDESCLVKYRCSRRRHKSWSISMQTELSL